MPLLKIDHSKKGTLILTSLLEDVDIYWMLVCKPTPVTMKKRARSLLKREASSPVMQSGWLPYEFINFEGRQSPAHVSTSQALSIVQGLVKGAMLIHVFEPQPLMKLNLNMLLLYPSRPKREGTTKLLASA